MQPPQERKRRKPPIPLVAWASASLVAHSSTGWWDSKGHAFAPPKTAEKRWKFLRFARVLIIFQIVFLQWILTNFISFHFEKNKKVDGVKDEAATTSIKDEALLGFHLA